MLRRPHHSVEPTGELRYQAFVEQVDALAVSHGSIRQRTLYGDLSTVLHTEGHDLIPSFKLIALMGANMTAADLANSVAKEIISLELIGENPDPENPPRYFDASFLLDRDKPDSWLEPLDHLGKPDTFTRVLGGCLLPTQTNFPDRWPPLKYTLRRHGLEQARVAELGSAAGWLLKFAMVESAGFRPKDIRIGRLALGRKGFIEDPVLSAKANALIQAPGFVVPAAKGFDIYPARSAVEQARVKAYTLYPEAMLDIAAQGELQRLIDHPWPEGLHLENEDMALDPKEFAALHQEDIGQYDAVTIPTSANQLPSREQQRNLLQNANLLRRTGGLIVFQDYGKFIYPDIFKHIRRRGRDVLMMSRTWNEFEYRQWVDDGTQDELHFRPVARFRSGRATVMALSRREQHQLEAMPDMPEVA